MQRIGSRMLVLLALGGCLQKNVDPCELRTVAAAPVALTTSLTDRLKAETILSHGIVTNISSTLIEIDSLFGKSGTRILTDIIMDTLPASLNMIGVRRRAASVLASTSAGRRKLDFSLKALVSSDSMFSWSTQTLITTSIIAEQLKGSDGTRSDLQGTRLAACRIRELDHIRLPSRSVPTWLPGTMDSLIVSTAVDLLATLETNQENWTELQSDALLARWRFRVPSKRVKEQLLKPN
jgi:hypothetical protein